MVILRPISLLTSSLIINLDSNSGTPLFSNVIVLWRKSRKMMGDERYCALIFLDIEQAFASVWLLYTLMLSKNRQCCTKSPAHTVKSSIWHHPRVYPANWLLANVSLIATMAITSTNINPSNANSKLWSDLNSLNKWIMENQRQHRQISINNQSINDTKKHLSISRPKQHTPVAVKTEVKYIGL